MNGLKVSDMFKQCAGCHLPKAPEGTNREIITHGWHRQCFITFYRETGDFEESEIQEMVEKYNNDEEIR